MHTQHTRVLSVEFTVHVCVSVFVLCDVCFCVFSHPEECMLRCLASDMLCEGCVDTYIFTYVHMFFSSLFIIYYIRMRKGFNFHTSYEG